jgi:class 3 adenylate cyclase
VRNALGRFERVSFEDDQARERARKRLLNAAKKHGIVPVGFITGQLRSERGRPVPGPPLPAGFVTFLLTDIEGSTVLLGKLGERYGGVLNDVRRIVRSAVVAAGGVEVDTRADELFAVFEQAPSAVEAAVSLQRTLGGRTWPDDLECRVRVGIHSGRPTLTENGYIGLPVNTTARVCSAGHGGQIVVSAKTTAAIEGTPVEGVNFRPLGRFRLPGLTRPESLFQVEAEGLQAEFPALRMEAASG